MLVVGDEAEADALSAPGTLPCPERLSVASIGLSLPEERKPTTRDFRHFKVSGFAAALAEGACPFDETIYLDNDITFAPERITSAFAPFREMEDNNEVLGAARAPMCLPPGHALGDIPASFCEYNSGVLYLPCKRAAAAIAQIMLQWRDSFREDGATADGHDQAAFRKVLYPRRDEVHVLGKEYNCRHLNDACVFFHRHFCRRDRGHGASASPDAAASRHQLCSKPRRSKKRP